MATLGQVTNAFRHILVIGLLSIVGLFLLITVFNAIKNSHPTPEKPPTVDFGKLPSISFPQNVTSQKFTYDVNTLSGNLPAFPDQVPVYKITQPQPSLTALDSAKSLLTNSGFTGEPVKVSDSLYAWTNDDTPPKTIQFNIFSNNFSLNSNYQTDIDVTSANNLPDQNGAINTAAGFLQNLSLYPNDVDASKTKVMLFSIANNQLTPASSLSNTQIIRVDFFQGNQNNLPIFYPQPTYSTMTFFVGGGNSLAQVVSGNFFHQGIAPDNGTYPIISAQVALQELEKGNVYIASFDNTSTTITIHNIVLGYYMSDTTQQYLQPIIVFEGDHNFYAYVSAIQSNWITQ